MKRTILIIMMLCVVLGATVTGQDSVAVRFTVEIVPQSKLNPDHKQELMEKVQAILARADAYADTSDFVVSADVVMTETRTAENTLRPMTTCEGELRLLAKNKVNGTTVNSVTLKLQSTFAESADTDVLMKLVRAIKVRDSRLVRFIHNSQNRAVQ